MARPPTPGAPSPDVELAHFIAHTKVAGVTVLPRLWAACLATTAFVACLPLDDLSGYSASVAPLTGSAGVGASGGVSGGTRQSTVGAASGEGLGGALSLDPSAVADASAGAGAAETGAASPPTVSIDAGACSGPDEFGSTQGQSCYWLPPDGALWVEARAACVSWGGDLVSIESAMEDDFLRQTLTNDVWIGVNDRDVEGTMVWADGSALAYANWAEEQPDDFGAQEDCVEKRVGDAGAWNDRPCEGTPQQFLCER